MLQISSGTLKGKKIKVMKSNLTRPVTSRFKELFFNVVSDTFIGNNILDLYAGTGVIGLEALSRGAGKCIFVEKSKYAVQLLYENMKRMELNDRVKIFRKDVSTFLKKNTPDLEFEIIFADPPYLNFDYLKLLGELRSSSLILSPSGQLILKVHKKQLEIISREFKFRSYGSGDVNLLLIESGELNEK